MKGEANEAKRSEIYRVKLVGRVVSVTRLTGALQINQTQWFWEGLTGDQEPRTFIASSYSVYSSTLLSPRQAFHTGMQNVPCRMISRECNKGCRTVTGHDDDDDDGHD